MWLANAGEDTVVKFDTDTNRQLARYKTWFSFNSFCTSNHCNNAYSGAAPSRTAVDSEGNVYVANRHFDGRPPSILKILASGGVDRNGNGTIDTSTDTNNDGAVSYTEMIALTDDNTNGILDTAELKDERVAWISHLPAAAAGGLGRSLAIDTQGNLWVGLYNRREYYKLSGATGAVMGGPFPVGGHTPYGAIVDATGTLWGASLSNNLLEFNTATQAFTTYTHSGSNYGIAIAPDNTNTLSVYLASQSGLCYTKFRKDLGTFTWPGGCSSLGVATDGAGNIFVGNSGGGVRKYNSAGVLQCTSAAQPGTGEVRGAVVDADNNVWLIHRTSDNVSKYRGSDCAHLGVFPSGNQPYTYTDATGIQRIGANPQGTFTAILNSGNPNQAWTKVAWNTEPQGAVPAGTSITVEARTAATQAGLAGATFQTLSNNTNVCLTGQFIELRTTLASTIPGTTPVLSDVAVSGRCDINGDGSVNTLDIQQLNQGRNQNASGACDPRDWDGSGRIDTNDSRQCALKCTKPNCAI
jgi:hypothetical protein